jgi:hypothetical protein
MHISDKQKGTYLHILNKMKSKCAKDFTQAEFADIFEVSLRTFGKFWRGEKIDMNMLLAFGNFIDFEILFWPNND